MTKQTTATIILSTLSLVYLSFQVGQTRQFYSLAAQQAQTKPPAATAERIYGVNQVLLFSPSQIEFGRVPDGKMARRTVNFENPGPEPVVIRQAKASCSCTSAVLRETSIPAGGKGQLEIVFNPALSSPEFAVSVSVEYDGTPKVDRLLVSGVVDRDLGR